MDLFNARFAAVTPTCHNEQNYPVDFGLVKLGASDHPSTPAYAPSPATVELITTELYATLIKNAGTTVDENLTASPRTREKQKV